MLIATVIPTYQRLRACDEENDLLALATELAPAACGFDRAAVTYLIHGRITVVGVPVAHPGSEDLRQAIAQAAATAPRRPADADGDADDLPASPDRLGLLHHVVARPATAGDLPIRVIADRRTGTVTDDDRDSVVTFASLVGLALERAILRRRSADLAHEARHFAGIAGALAADIVDAPIALPTDHGLGAVFPRVAVPLAEGERFAELSPQERRVAVLLVDGRSNREIGEALAVSPETVKTHVTRIRRKLGAANRVEVVSQLLGVGDGDG